MKKIAIIIPIFFFSVVLIAQSDIIYPVKSKKVIRNCKITQVKNISMVYYTKHFISDSVEAYAITKDGNYITLSLDKINLYDNNLDFKNGSFNYKGHDYSYYEHKYKRALGSFIAGTILAVPVGATLLILGVTSANGLEKGDPGRIILVAPGYIITNVGISLLIYGGIKSHNNKRAMNRIKKYSNLTFGPTNNGVGLVLRF